MVIYYPISFCSWVYSNGWFFLALGINYRIAFSLILIWREKYPLDGNLMLGDNNPVGSPGSLSSIPYNQSDIFWDYPGRFGLGRMIFWWFQSFLEGQSLDSS